MSAWHFINIDWTGFFFWGGNKVFIVHFEKLWVNKLGIITKPQQYLIKFSRNHQPKGVKMQVENADVKSLCLYL